MRIPCNTLFLDLTIFIIIIFMTWYFIPRVLKLAKVKMYVRNGYDGDSKTVNVMARHTSLKRWIATEIRWYRNVVSRGSAVQSVALLPISTMRLWALSDKGPRVSTATGKTCEWRRAYCTWSSISQTQPLQHFLHVAHFATRRMLLLLLLLLLLQPLQALIIGIS